MAYARFGAGSDVYVFPHVDGFVQCCGCGLSKWDDPMAEWDHYSAESIVAHLRTHVAAGHEVPEELLEESFYPDEDFTPWRPKSHD